MLLREEKTTSSWYNFDAQEIMQGLSVFQWILDSKLFDHVLKVVVVVAYYYEIVYIHEYVSYAAFIIVYEQGAINC